jgi:hypothetical protein
VGRAVTNRVKHLPSDRLLILFHFRNEEIRAARSDSVNLSPPKKQSIAN